MARTLARGAARLLIAVAAPRWRCSSRARSARSRRCSRRGRSASSRSGRGARPAADVALPDRPRHRDRVGSRLRRLAHRLAARGPARLLARSRSLPGLLPGRCARLRRWPRRAAAPQRGSRRSGLGLAAGVPRRLRRRPGGARAALHVLRVSRRDRASDAERGRGRRDRARRDLPAVVPASRRGAAAVGGGARAGGSPGRRRRHRRGRRRPARRRAVGSRPHHLRARCRGCRFAAVLFGLLRLCRRGRSSGSRRWRAQSCSNPGRASLERGTLRQAGSRPGSRNGATWPVCAR